MQEHVVQEMFADFVAEAPCHCSISRVVVPEK